MRDARIIRFALSGARTADPLKLVATATPAERLDYGRQDVGVKQGVVPRAVFRDFRDFRDFRGPYLELRSFHGDAIRPHRIGDPRNREAQTDLGTAHLEEEIR
jgi:hypothetical protein